MTYSYFRDINKHVVTGQSPISGGRNLIATSSCSLTRSHEGQGRSTQRFQNSRDLFCVIPPKQLQRLLPPPVRTNAPVVLTRAVHPLTHRTEDVIVGVLQPLGVVDDNFISTIFPAECVENPIHDDTDAMLADLHNRSRPTLLRDEGKF